MDDRPRRVGWPARRGRFRDRGLSHRWPAPAMSPTMHACLVPCVCRRMPGRLGPRPSSGHAAARRPCRTWSGRAAGSSV